MLVRHPLSGPTMHSGLMLRTPLVRDTRGRVNVHCALWLHVILSQADYHDEDELHSESPSCSSLLTPWTAMPWPFVSCCWPCKMQTHPGQRSQLSLRHQRHSVVGVLTIQRPQSDWLPALPSTLSAKGSRADGRLLSLRKAMSEERPQSIGGESLPQESPLLCRVTEAMREQGEKERVKEREDAVLLTHTCRKKEGESYKVEWDRKAERQMHSATSPDSCSKTCFHLGHPQFSLT